MSLNDLPATRRTFAGFHIKTGPMTYKFKSTKKTTELLISG